MSSASELFSPYARADSRRCEKVASCARSTFDRALRNAAVSATSPFHHGLSEGQLSTKEGDALHRPYGLDDRFDQREPRIM